MRSTIKISANTSLNNILDNYARILKIQNQMAKGRRVINPADDPLAANVGMRIDTLLKRLTQYNRNNDIADSFLGLADGALNDINQLLIKAKSLTIGAASDTTTQEMRRANAVEMNNLLQELVNIANRKDGTRYLFGGTETMTQPYTIVGGRYVYYRGNEKEIAVQTDAGSFLPINITGENVFGSMLSIVKSRDLSPDLDAGLDTSTRLQDLNRGDGVPAGSINIRFGGFTRNGLDIDLSAADTVEDIKDIIEKATLSASANLNPGTPPDPVIVDQQDRYIRVEIKPDRSGLVLSEMDLGTSGATPAGPTGNAIQLSEVGGNTVAKALGFQGANTVGAMLIGRDLDPAITTLTLLADLKDYSDGILSIANGAPPDSVQIREINDINNQVGEWSLTGLASGVNINEKGELYLRITPVGAGATIELFNGKERDPSQRIAVGTSSALGTVVLNEDNNSGVSGTVSLQANFAADIDMTAAFPPTFATAIPLNVRAFEEGGSLPSPFTQWHVRGLTREMFASSVDGLVHDTTLYVSIVTNAGAREVHLYRNDAASGAPVYVEVANGALPPGVDNGTVILGGTASYPQVLGSVSLEYAADEAIGTHTITPTFKTVGDLINAVNSSNTYTTARIDDTKRGIEIISHLGGAYLTVSEARQNAPITGDTNARLTHLNLSGVVQGKNTDVNGNIYVSVIDYGPTPPPDKAGRFEVALYSDAARTALVASGVTNSAGPLTLALAEANRSGLSGSVDLDLATVVLDGATSPLAAPPPGYAPFPRQENDIIVALRGYEITGDDQGANPDGHQLSHLSLQGMVQGVNTDADGNLYAWVRQVGANYVVELYRDPGMAAADLVASGTIASANGIVTLVPQNTASISAQLRGTVRLAYNADDNSIILTPPKGLGLSGEKREQNVFATFNDTMDAMLANDAETLHDLLAAYKTDLDRILMGRADIGSRQDRLQMTRERHEDEKINFGRIRSEQIELDFAKAVTEFQAKQNVFEASLRVAAQIVPMSLVDFL